MRLMLILLATLLLAGCGDRTRLRDIPQQPDPNTPPPGTSTGTEKYPR